MKRSPSWLAAIAFAGVLSVNGGVLRAMSDRTATLVMTAQVGARTALRVSAERLRFDVTDPGAPAVAAVDFVAAARTRHDGEVILTVQPERWIEGPGGAADVDASVVFTGEGAGTVSGELRPAAPATAGRWVGSGRRTGRLLFALRAGVEGTYVLPVRFVLSAP